MRKKKGISSASRKKHNGIFWKYPLIHLGLNSFLSQISGKYSARKQAILLTTLSLRAKKKIEWETYPIITVFSPRPLGQFWVDFLPLRLSHQFQHFTLAYFEAAAISRNVLSVFEDFTGWKESKLEMISFNNSVLALV